MKTSAPLNPLPEAPAPAPAPAACQGHPLFRLENLYRAYWACRKRKRGTANALRFEADLEANLLELHGCLSDGTYRPRPAIAFLVQKPKRREIFAADFRDRVVHHLLVAHLEPVWERRFIHDSYACRRGKGTHKGVDRCQQFMRQASANGTRPAFYLQLDVEGFFVAIDRARLYVRLINKEPDPVVRWLMAVVVFNEPTEHCRLRGHPLTDFLALPAHKTLFRCPPGCGLPIGNLTSQFFANVYLDALDQFVKHRLGARWYLRYCDDLVLMSQGADQLRDWERQIEAFLHDRLALRLNERRKLRPLGDGIDFLGYVIRTDYRLVRRRVVGNLTQRLAEAERRLRLAGLGERDGRLVLPWPAGLLEQVRHWLNAYLAHFAKAETWRLVAAIRARHAWLEAYFDWSGGSLTPRHGLRADYPSLRAQVLDAARQLPGSLLVLRTGAFYRLSPLALPGAADGLARVHVSQHEALVAQLWAGPHPVAWLEETGRHLGRVAERVLTLHWGARRRPASDAAPLSSTF